VQFGIRRTFSLDNLHQKRLNTPAMKPFDQTLVNSTLIFISPLIILPFFLAIRASFRYILTRKTNKTKQTEAMKNIDTLIAEAKGKFFSITFEKKDGTLRTINGKDKYLRLIAGAVSTPSIDGLREAGYKSAINRNRESWFSFQPEKVKAFKCGKTEHTF
jgi:hypothetical protein